MVVDVSVFDGGAPVDVVLLVSVAGGRAGSLVPVVSVRNTPPVSVESGGGPVSVVVTDPSVLVGCAVSSAIGFPN